jgi:hypothetical protein
VSTPAKPKPVIWLPDTAFLVTAALTQELFEDVRAVLGDAKHRIGYLTVAADELVGFTSTWTDPTTGSRDLATMYAWLGAPKEIHDQGILEEAGRIQIEVAASRRLRHPGEHWAESVIVATASHISQLTPSFLSDDYNARVAAHARNIRSRWLV